MNKIKSHQLNRIFNNKTIGSSELVQLLNEYFLSMHKNKTEISQGIQLAKVKLGHFEDVKSYLSQLKSVNRTEKRLLNFLNSYSIKHKDNIEIIFNKMYRRLKSLNRFITLSRSRTVMDILKLWHKKNKNIKVIVCESRPIYEGRLMAKELADKGISVELITDAMMGMIVPEVDAAIIGADNILKNGNVVNKVGSKALAVLCKEYKKPFYVVTTKSKFSKRNSFNLKMENPKEVWDKSSKNLNVSNIYFEEVEKKFIRKIFTD